MIDAIDNERAELPSHFRELVETLTISSVQALYLRS